MSPHLGALWEEIQELQKQFGRMRLGLPDNNEQQEIRADNLTLPKNFPEVPLLTNYQDFFKEIDAFRASSNTLDEPARQPLQMQVSGANPQAAVGSSSNGSHKHKAMLTQLPEEPVKTRLRQEPDVRSMQKRKATSTPLPGEARRKSVRVGHATIKFISNDQNDDPCK
ncbi:hypothetical protein AAF712_012943 [Marasmius tenuissimus]|uniref:Uncharacterized protein n=1 Tax=Marasmius tenuissimus TaxID=585030 RepID=A0ABR2ZG24_9AGAR